MSAKRTAWNEFSSSIASAVICLATGRKFNFSTYIFDSMVTNVDIPSKFLMCPRFLPVMINTQVDDLSSHNTKYTSPALTQKVFANIKRIGKGFSGVETPLFDTMLVQPQVQDAAKVEEDEDDEVSAAPTPPSPTPATTSPPQQQPIPSLAQASPALLSSPLQEQPTQPTHTLESSMTLLNKLMETCVTLTQKVSHIKQDKTAQALETAKLKQRVEKLERKRRSKYSGLKRGEITELDADEDVTLVDVDTALKMDVNIQGRVEEDVTTVKEVNATEPAVFDDEEVTMIMAQTLIKIKAKKARLLDEQMAKRLEDEELEQAAAREKHEKEDLERAKVLQQQYEQKQENISWNVVVEQMQKKHLDNIKQYQSLKRKMIPTFYDDGDDDYTFAITPIEPDNSEHFDTIPTTKSDEFIKFSVENLVLIPNFSKEIYSNLLFDEEIISMKIGHHHFNAEFDIIESLLNHESSIICSLKIDSLFDEFADELTILKSIPPGIDETNCDPEDETDFIKRLLYDNSFSRPPKEFVYANSDAKIESFSPSPIPVKECDSLMKEIDLSFTPNYPMLSGIEEDDYNSKRDILILEEFLSKDSLSVILF
nr:hypothetical protein [Tanacetum cinerariifolium]